MRIGIFGGSFDPVHNGHLILAECALQQLQLESVWFVPAAQQPLKPQGPLASNSHRTAMLRLALADRAAMEISTRELDRGGVSYTADTLASICAEQPESELYLLLGSDALVEFAQWHAPDRICEMAILAVVHRAGSREVDFDPIHDVVTAERLKEIKLSQIEMPATPISSSEIRSQIAGGGSWESMVPGAVASYIVAENLYR